MQTLPLSKTQRVYLIKNGLAENVRVVQSITKHAKKAQKDFNCVFLDVAESFDSVAQEVVIEAEKQIGLRNIILQ